MTALLSVELYEAELYFQKLTVIDLQEKLLQRARPWQEEEKAQ